MKMNTDWFIDTKLGYSWAHGLSTVTKKTKKQKNSCAEIQSPALDHPSFFSTAWQLRYFTRGVPGTHSSCGSPEEGTCEITWHVNQHCMATIRIHQILRSAKQTGEVVIRDQLCVWSTYLVVAVLRFGERLQQILITLPVMSFVKCSLARGWPSSISWCQKKKYLATSCVQWICKIEFHSSAWLFSWSR